MMTFEEVRKTLENARETLEARSRLFSARDIDDIIDGIADAGDVMQGVLDGVEHVMRNFRRIVPVLPILPNRTEIELKIINIVSNLQSAVRVAKQ